MGDPAGLERGIAVAARQCVVAAEAQARSSAPLKRKLQSSVGLCSEVFVDIEIADEQSRRRVLVVQGEHTPLIEISVRAAGWIENPEQRARAGPEEHAGIDGELVPQTIRIAAQIARFHLPGASKLFLDGH